MNTPGRGERGFTLIELSIVLVVIGLIVGGVLAGKSLIYTARIRQVGTELQKYSTAVATFRVKYDCLPGDCANATSFFGTDSNGCPLGGGATGTCNGNGDGTVNGFAAGPAVEGLAAWKQLALAGLIQGSYPGNGGNVTYAKIPGVNIPLSAYGSNVGYNLFTTFGNGGCIEPANGSITLQIAAPQTSGICGTDFLGGSGFTAPDAQALDTKFDDGIPGTGSLMSYDGTGTSLSNPNLSCKTFINSQYSYLTSSASGCMLYYNLRIE